MKTIILINGQKRSGKDFTANIIEKQLEGSKNVTSLSFADPLKEIVADTFGITREQLDDYKNDGTPLFLEEAKIDGYDYHKVTDFRTILQRFGTEGMKPQFGEAVWANLALSKACNVDESTPSVILIPDFRFNIEYEVISSSTYRVITLHIKNDDLDKGDLHASERELDEFEFDHIIDNTGYSNYLESRVEDFIEKFDIKE